MIDPSEYKARRLSLAKQIGKDNIAIIPAASEIIRNGDVHYRFRQDSDFYYLTGFNEPDCLLLIEGGSGETILFNRPLDPIAEIWTEGRLGQENAPSILGINAAYSIDTIDLRLSELLAGKKNIYCFIDRYPFWREKIIDACQILKKSIRGGINAPDVFRDLSSIIGEMRLIKSTEEIETIIRAVNVSIKAHESAMNICKPGLFEYELEAALLNEFKKGGCEDVAYFPIVAAGDNACILHYTSNNKMLNDGDLILIDAGGEYKNYAADITRTFPINGRFSLEQKLIYELVLSAQQSAIELIKPGVLWIEIQKKNC